MRAALRPVVRSLVRLLVARPARRLAGPLALASAALASPVAAEGLALDVGSLSWARLQGRVGYASAPVWTAGPAYATDRQPVGGGLRLGGASLLGDVYLSVLPEGFRATSGVLLDARSGVSALSTGSAGPRLGLAAQPFGDRGHDGLAPLPYLGIGYSALARPAGGWSFSADLGVVRGGADAGRYGRVFGNTAGQNLDEAVRELRYQPLVQVGASYSF